MYFGVKLRTFQGFFIPVWFGVGQVQKTVLSSHLKTLKLSVGGGAMFGYCPAVEQVILEFKNSRIV